MLWEQPKNKLKKKKKNGKRKFFFLNLIRKGKTEFYVSWIPGEKRENGAKAISEEIIADNFDERH